MLTTAEKDLLSRTIAKTFDTAIADVQDDMDNGGVDPDGDTFERLEMRKVEANTLKGNVMFHIDRLDVSDPA